MAINFILLLKHVPHGVEGLNAPLCVVGQLVCISYDDAEHFIVLHHDETLQDGIPIRRFAERFQVLHKLIKILGFRLKPYDCQCLLHDTLSQLLTNRRKGNTDGLDRLCLDRDVVNGLLDRTIPLQMFWSLFLGSTLAMCRFSAFVDNTVSIQRQAMPPAIDRMVHAIPTGASWFKPK